jgi:hypothetical protein
VILGQQDQYVPPQHARDQKQAFPHARIEIPPDSGHWAHIDNAARVRSLIVPFLRPRLRAAASGRGRRIRVRVTVNGLLAAHGVTARVGRSVSSPLTISGKRTLVLRVHKPLRAGVHVVTVRALGLPARRARFVVRARSAGRDVERLRPAPDGAA